MPSSSLFLRSSTTLVSALSLFSSAFAAPQSLYERQSTAPYKLVKDYSGASFFDQFSFFDQADPTHGYVTYGNRQYAVDNNLISFDGTYNYMKVDNTNTYRQTTGYYNNNNIGRKSVRIEGTQKYTRALIITDVAHMPSGICGAWPAFWTLGDNWPYNGEIDIIEGANKQGGNWMSLHTGSSSNLNGNSDVFAAQISDRDCNVYTRGKDNPNYTGCKFVDPDSATYDNYAGGVWAMQWTSDRIKVWFWRYGQVPSDVNSDSPNPNSWGTPRSSFAPPENLRVDANFNAHKIIFDTTFCGDLGDATWQSSGCAASTRSDSCASYVANNPHAFDDAFWKVKYVKVYQNDGKTTTTTSKTTSQTTTTTSSIKTTTPTTTTTSSSAKTTTTTSATTTTTSSSSKTTTTASSTTSSSSSSASKTTSSSAVTSSSSTSSGSSSSTSSGSSSSTSSGSSSSTSSGSSSATTSGSSSSTSSGSSTTTSSSSAGATTTGTSSSLTSSGSSTTGTSSTTAGGIITSTTSVGTSSTVTSSGSSTTDSSTTNGGITSSSSSTSSDSSSSVSGISTSTDSASTTSTTWSAWTWTSTTTGPADSWETWTTTTTKSYDPSTWATWNSWTTSKPTEPSTWNSWTTKSVDPWVSWKPTPTSDPWQSWSEVTTKPAGGFYGYNGDDSEWYTKTITDTITVPCTTAPYWETTVTVYETKVPVHPENYITKTITDVITVPCTTEPYWETKTTSYVTLVPVKDNTATWTDVAIQTSYPVISVTVEPKPTNWIPVNDKSSVWASASVPVPVNGQTTWATASVPATPVKPTTWATAAVPPAGQTGTNWNGWTGLNATATNVKVWQGAAPSVFANVNVVLAAVAAAGAALML